MADMKAHYVHDDEDPSRVIAMVHPASAKSVRSVLAADPSSPDGRSPWMWVRLPNGDLVLGVYPQGTTYENVEEDAFFRG